MMFDRPKVTYDEAAMTPDGNDPDYAVRPLNPFTVGSTLYVPARGVTGATMTQDDGLQVYLLMLDAGRMGLAQPFTAHAAREFAASVIRAADAIEAAQIAKASAQLAATLRKGAPE